MLSLPAQAQLVFEPGSTGNPVGDITADGFGPLTFSPNADSIDLAINADSNTRIAWSDGQALKWHMHNPMAWPLTLEVSLTDKAGSVLRTTIAPPPGAAFTLVIPLKAGSPLAWGMRAPPPALFEHERERLLVASSVQGKLNIQALSSIRLRIPTPDSEQTVRIGKAFLSQTSNEEKALYTQIVDCFGQFSRIDWPSKTHADCAAETSISRPETSPSGLQTDEPGEALYRDRFGGLNVTGWPSKKYATGYFRTYKDTRAADSRWLLLSPDGNPFFSIGVNAVQMSNSETFIEGREFMFESLPDKANPLAAFYGQRPGPPDRDAGAQKGRKFGQGRNFDFYRANLWRRDGPDYAKHWHQASDQRLSDWSFNTVGAWSDESHTSVSALPYTQIVHIEGSFTRLSDGIDWWGGIADPFDPAFLAALKAQLAEVVRPRRNDPRLIGYFVDNEIAWGDGSASDPEIRWALALHVLGTDASSTSAYAKRAFLKKLREQYKSPETFAQAWAYPIADWSDLNAAIPASKLTMTTNSKVSQDLQALSALLADRYYSLVSQTLKALDPNHLYLGSRFAARTPEAVAACVRHCDIVSFNLYIPDLNNGFEADQFARHNKPAMLTEFHFGSPDSGPFWPGVMSVAQEQDRAPAYHRMLESVLDNRQFVGAHWFQYLDQAVTGRWLDGENGHLGLVDITDKPWRGFTTAVSKTNSSILQQLRLQLRKP